MTESDKGSMFASESEKQTFVFQELSLLIKEFELGEIQLTNLDRIHLSIRTQAPLKDIDTFLVSNGYSKEDSKWATTYHKYVDEYAVASNVSLDKTRQQLVISLNY